VIGFAKGSFNRVERNGAYDENGHRRVVTLSEKVVGLSEEVVILSEKVVILSEKVVILSAAKDLLSLVVAGQ